jgi:predicted RNase H-like nuclease
MDNCSSSLRLVLGIDAAWTVSQPSGVALVAETATGWRLVAVEASYQRFLARAHRLPRDEHPTGSIPDPEALLASSHILCGGPVSLVAIDMPLGMTPIVGRRTCDDLISKTYGARKCGTHTPSVSRPGRISDDLRARFDAAGYPLLTRGIASPGVIEVYPHPALVELANAAERLPYKASKVAKYWPSATPVQRRALLYGEWARIVQLLENKIAGVAPALAIPTESASRRDLKAFEDKLDAVICACVGVCALETRATPFGDERSAIWIPMLGVTSSQQPSVAASSRY